jgi:hypothetical protein
LPPTWKQKEKNVLKQKKILNGTDRFEKCKTVVGILKLPFI